MIHVIVWCVVASFGICVCGGVVITCVAHSSAVDALFGVRVCGVVLDSCVVRLSSVVAYWAL